MAYYFFATLDNWKTLLAFIAVFTVFISFVTFVSWMEGHYYDDKKVRRVLKAGPIICCIAALLLAMIPSQKQLAFILVAPKIIENQDIQNGLQNSTEVFNLGTQYLKETLKQLGEEIVNENNSK